MASPALTSTLRWLLALVVVATGIRASTSTTVKNHIVFLNSYGLREMERHSAGLFSSGAREQFRSNALRHHNTVLARVARGQAPVRKLHDYTTIVNGFSAMVTEEQAAQLQSDPDVLLVKEAKLVKLFTTHSYAFLRLNATKGVWKTTTGTDAIIGVIDTGIWPESASFVDRGYGPIPKKFKGICQTGSDNFKCNRKLIGARFFGEAFAVVYNDRLRNLCRRFGDYLSPRDLDGHGTHCASVAAGGVTSSPQIAGAKLGVARGVAYGARLAVYKVFWCGLGASNSDIVAAMDSAVSDGVDVLSLSLGSGPDMPNVAFQDPIYYAAYMATKAGVPVVFAAGNAGPEWYTAANAVPWVMTVGAGTVDRKYTSKLVLGSKVALQGDCNPSTGTPSASARKYYPLVSAANAPISRGEIEKARLCGPRSLDPAKVRGKVVLCLRGEVPLYDKAKAVKDAGGVGIILYNVQGDRRPLPMLELDFPNVHFGHTDGLAIGQYIGKTRNPMAYIETCRAAVGAAPREAPFVADFSSMGPNGGSLNILKPDIIAPGEDIIVAWSQSQSPNADYSAPWRMVSGTSTACPHVAGAVALLRSLYPSWKPSMYFSALMTTASLKTNRNRIIRAADGRTIASPFEVGAGHLNPTAASDPGLVYAVSDGYKSFYCSPDSGVAESLDDSDVRAKCGKYPSTRAVDLNLPSIAFFRVGNVTRTVRTLTNVGGAGTYTVSVTQAAGATIKVVPSKLSFSAGQSRSYTVTLTPSQKTRTVKGAIVTVATALDTFGPRVAWTVGSITWADGKGHRVRVNVVVNIV